MADKVEMRPAYEEDCREMLAEYGGDPDEWQTGRWMTRPDEVVCDHCKAEFETEDV